VLLDRLSEVYTVYVVCVCVCVIVTRCVETLDDSCRRLSPVQMTEQLHRVERCIRVLERVSHMSVFHVALLTGHLRTSVLHVALLTGHLCG